MSAYKLFHHIKDTNIFDKHETLSILYNVTPSENPHPDVEARQSFISYNRDYSSMGKHQSPVMRLCQSHAGSETVPFPKIDH